MNQPKQEFRMLAPEGFHQVISRRAIFQAGTAAAGLAILAACGSDKKDSSSNTDGTGGDTGGLSDLLKQYSNIVNKSSGTLSMFTWGAYNDPDIVGSLADTDLGVTMQVDYYNSNEDLVTKLSAAAGTGGFDIVVPTGPFVPQLIEKGLLQKLDMAQLPNFVNIDPIYNGRSWDPNNEYTVCKDWGSTGWLYNKAVIDREIATWADFIDVCMNEGSGRCSMLDSAGNLTGMYFWANGIDWTTEKKEDLDAAEAFLVGEFASHVSGFDSYPSTAVAQGSYDISMMWNGDARAAFSNILDAGGNPDDWVWGLGAPETELWMDNYCIPEGAPNPEAAHAWINWLLTPQISIKDLEFHGYHSGMKHIDQLIAELAPDLTHPEMIFFTDEQVATMRTGAVNSAQDRIVSILDQMKAEAGS
jgi:spermidine/putrescine transport system substrate-binding protein